MDDNRVLFYTLLRFYFVFSEGLILIESLLYSATFIVNLYHTSPYYNPRIIVYYTLPYI